MFEQRRLSAAGRAQQDDDFSSRDLEVDAVQRVNLHLARGVGLGQCLRGEDGLGHG